MSECERVVTTTTTTTTTTNNNNNDKNSSNSNAEQQQQQQQQQHTHAQQHGQPHAKVEAEEGLDGGLAEVVLHAEEREEGEHVDVDGAGPQRQEEHDEVRVVEHLEQPPPEPLHGQHGAHQRERERHPAPHGDDVAGAEVLLVFAQQPTTTSKQQQTTTKVTTDDDGRRRTTTTTTTTTPNSSSSSNITHAGTQERTRAHARRQGKGYRSSSI